MTKARKAIRRKKVKHSIDSEWIYLKKSSIHNRGVFAFKNIPKDTEIVQYTGRKIRKKDSSAQSKRDDKNGTVYLFEVNLHFYIDGADKGSDAIYINHGCKPNCETQIEDNEIWIVALRRIKKGEELSYDYGFEPDVAIDSPCRCGHRNCRKYIVRETDFKKFKKILLKANRS
jgi:hypothetical protein